MKIKYFPNPDVLRVTFRETPSSKPEIVDHSRIVHKDRRGNITAVEFLNASEELNPHGLSDQAKKAIADFAKTNPIIPAHRKQTKEAQDEPQERGPLPG